MLNLNNLVTVTLETSYYITSTLHFKQTWNAYNADPSTLEN